MLKKIKRGKRKQKERNIKCEKKETKEDNTS